MKRSYEFSKNNTDTFEEKGSDMVCGRNAVLELLKSEREIDRILIAPSDNKGSLVKISALARDRGIPVKNTTQQKLDSITSQVHQGVIAFCAAHTYSTVDEILKRAEDAGHPPFIIITDELEDPHNLGAILRTAEACGVDGVIIPKRRNVGLTSIVAKTSAGAVEYVPVARVPNIVSVIEELKDKGVWFYAADMDGQDWCSTDFSGAVGLIVGSEGNGVSRLVKEKCDFTVSLPMQGKINSLNASVAASVLCYEIARQRLGLKAFNK